MPKANKNKAAPNSSEVFCVPKSPNSPKRRTVTHKIGHPLAKTKLRWAIITTVEKYSQQLADVMVEKALMGDVPMIKELLDRVMGKAQQQIDVTSNGEQMGVILYPHLPDSEGK